MDNKEQKALMKSVATNDLPDIDLYMDQVTGLLKEKLGNLAGIDKNPVLTKTMINNYVKSGVVDKPLKKRYSKDQMMQMILIYSLKSVLPLQQIKEFMTLLRDECDPEDFEKVYELFFQVQQEVSDERQVELTESTEPSLEDILGWAVRADLYKRMTLNALEERQKK
jgi:DNA-binding transcriptional MerR regulator